MQYNSAEYFARSVHKGQKYENGKDYCDEHLSKVVKIAKFLGNLSNISIIDDVAWLHDTIEDTAITYYDLEQTFGSNIARAVELLTRDGTEEQYLEKLRNSAYVVKIVKLADILANLSNLGTYKGNALKYSLKKSEEIKACLDVLI